MVPVSTRDKFPTDDMFGETVNVKVGIKPSPVETFVLHKGVLCFYSNYFDAALKQDTFKEGQSKLIELPEEEVSIFRMFVRWLYIRQFAEPGRCQFLPFYQVWSFADRRQVPLLMNMMIDRLVEKCMKESVVPSVNLHFAYENTTAEAGLRRVLIKLISQWGGPAMLTVDSKSSWLADAVWDMTCAMVEQKNSGITRYESVQRMADIDLCEYHCHEKGVRCAKT